MRIVSTTCSNTEIVCALGCGDTLVGIDRHSDHPPETVRRLPRVGSDLNIDVEAVCALRPDWVLASLTVPGHERVVASLKAAGLNVIAPGPTSVRDVCADFRAIAALLDVGERGERLAQDLESELERAAERAARNPGLRPRVLVEWWPKPVIVPGKLSWVTDLIHAAGAVNPWGEVPVKSTPVAVDAVVAAMPDAVVIAWCGVQSRNYRPEQVYRRAGWEQVPAVSNLRVRAVPEAYLGRPGPRLAAGLHALESLVAEFAAPPALPRAD